ncbi:MAG TPA: hypothetical protein VGI39_22380 [Polyangiaceae bacterium]
MVNNGDCFYNRQSDVKVMHFPPQGESGATCGGSTLCCTDVVCCEGTCGAACIK